MSILETNATHRSSCVQIISNEGFSIMTVFKILKGARSLEKLKRLKGAS